MFRLERIGKVRSEQMQRDGELITKHPLLIPKTLADKLSDKVSVIIAPPPAGGGFIGNALLGASAVAQQAPAGTAPAQAIGSEAFAALGSRADRLARRTSSRRAKTDDAAIAAHLDVAASLGVTLRSVEREGRVTLCYDGEAFRRVLALPAADDVQAETALALTRPDCVPPDLSPAAHYEYDAWRSDVSATSSSPAGCPARISCWPRAKPRSTAASGAASKSST